MTGKTIRCAFTVFVAAAFGTVGCGLRPPQTGGPPAIGVNVAKGHATIIVAPKVVEADVYQSQAVIEKNTKGRVHHLTLSLLKREGTEYRPVPGPDGQPVAVTLQNSELSSTVELSGLAFNSEYRVVARAFKNPGSSSPDKISRDDLSFVDVAVGVDSLPMSRPIEVHLEDSPFVGQQGSALQFNPGKLVSQGSEGAVVVPPPLTFTQVSLDTPLDSGEIVPQVMLAFAIDPETNQSFPISDSALLAALQTSSSLVIVTLIGVRATEAGAIETLRFRVDTDVGDFAVKLQFSNSGLVWEDPGSGFVISTIDWPVLLEQAIGSEADRTVQAVWAPFILAVVAAAVGFVGGFFAGRIYERRHNSTSSPTSPPSGSPGSPPPSGGSLPPSGESPTPPPSDDPPVNIPNLGITPPPFKTYEEAEQWIDNAPIPPATKAALKKFYQNMNWVKGQFGPAFGGDIPSDPTPSSTPPADGGGDPTPPPGGDGPTGPQSLGPVRDIGGFGVYVGSTTIPPGYEGEYTVSASLATLGSLGSATLSGPAGSKTVSFETWNYFWGPYLGVGDPAIWSISFDRWNSYNPYFPDAVTKITKKFFVYNDPWRGTQTLLLSAL